MPALQDRPSDAAAPAVARPAARPVMITMLPTPTSPLRPSAVLLRDPRRSPGATPESSEIYPHQRPQQPIGSHQRAIIEPSSSPRYPSTYRRPHPPASTATRSSRNLHSPSHYPAECTQSHAFIQPSLRARTGRANSNSFFTIPESSITLPESAPISETSSQWTLPSSGESANPRSLTKD